MPAWLIVVLTIIGTLAFAYVAAAIWLAKVFLK